VEGFCEHGNEPLGCIKYWEIFEQLSDWCFLTKNSFTWKWLVSLLVVLFKH
jgi:hypothetical protein